MQSRRAVLAGLANSLLAKGLLLPGAPGRALLARAHGLTAAASGAALAGCAAAPPGRPPSPEAAPAVLPQRFGDAKPHPWEGAPPQSLAVHGIDVARWQASIDWGAARAEGVNFAFIKATEGADGTHLNPEFGRQWRESRAAGVPRSAYHLYYWCGTPEAQARHFIDTVPRVPGDLPPVLDLEWNPLSPSCRLRPSPAEIADIVRRYSALIRQHYGQRPILYMTVDFFADARLPGLDGEDLWLRSVAAHPSIPYGRGDFRFWQYSGTGLINGIAGEVDLNAFNGSIADWQRWLAARRIR